MAALIQNVIADGVGRRDEYRAIRADNTIFDAEIGSGSIHSEDVNSASLVCSIQDISIRKLGERQLHYHATLQDNVSDAVIAVDLQFRVQSWNLAAESMYGWRANEAIDRMAQELLQTQVISGESLKDVSQEVAASGRWKGEVIQHHRDGSEVFVLSSLNLLRDENGKPLGIVGIDHDITKRKQMEDDLRASLAKEKELNELKMRFVSMVSHDFRTPLSVIKSSMEILQTYSERMDEDGKAKHFEKINSQLSRMIDLLNDVLTISRVDAGKLPFTPVLLDLDQLCRQLADEFQSDLTMNHRLIYSFSGESMRVSVDEKLLQRAPSTC